MPLFESHVLSQRVVATDYLELEFTWPDAIAQPEPGQFVTIRTGATTVPLLRRPFGVSEWTPGRARMIYWKRGPATRELAAMERGTTIDMMGPLGRGFPMPSASARAVLVAGGVGIGPIVLLAHHLQESGAGVRPLVVIGARTQSGLPKVELGDEVDVVRTTDDGSAGRAGSSIEALAAELDSYGGAQEVYLCGPHGMLRAGHDVCAERSITAWVSMEQMMGCAVGACMGCVVEVAGRDRGSNDGTLYKRVCTEGPVFDSREIAW